MKKEAQKRKAEAETKRRSGTYDKAVAEYDKAMRQFQKKNYAEAKEHLKAVLDGYPEELEVGERAQVWLKVLDEQVSPKKAKPKTPEDHYLLGVLEHNAGEYDTAIREFEKALEMTPSDDRLHYALAASHCRAGREKEALQELRKAIGKSREHAIRAIRDDDFDALDAHPEFMELTEQAEGGGAGA